MYEASTRRKQETERGSVKGRTTHNDVNASLSPRIFPTFTKFRKTRACVVDVERGWSHDLAVTRYRNAAKMRYDRNMENLDVSSRVCSSLIDGLVPAGGGSPFFSDVLASGVVETGN